MHYVKWKNIQIFELTLKIDGVGSWFDNWQIKNGKIRKNGRIDK